MIVLYQPPPCWGLPSMSPFCVKLETYFRMTGVPYKTATADFRKAPKGRIPYVELDGKLMGDSNLIISELTGKNEEPLSAKFSPEQRAKGLVIQRLFEEHLYFGGAYLRWKGEESWRHVRAVLEPMMPPLVGGIVLKAVRKSFLNELRKNSLCEHSDEEIISFMKADLQAASDLLGDQPFFLGSEPSLVDATAYGFLIQTLWAPWDSPLKRFARTLSNLEPYCLRMKGRYWT